MIESNERDINILMLIYNFCPLIGGTEKQCLLQAKKLEEMGHKVQILTTEQNGQSSFEIIDGLAELSGCLYLFVQQFFSS
jgi:hypothetical protein